MKPKKNTSLAEKIANVLNTTPASFDPEDEAIDSTTAQVITNEHDNDDDQGNDGAEEEAILSKFRKQNIDLLCDIDTKYAGKKASRKNLNESDGESDDGYSASNDEADDNRVDEEEDDDDDDNEVGDSRADEEEDDDNDDEEEDDEIDEEEDDEIDEEEDDEIDEDEASNYSLSENGEPNFKHMSVSNVSNQMKKANCVRNQISLWEHLLEIRIQLQKSLITANRMPAIEYFNDIKQQSGQEFCNKLTETKSNIYNVLDKLLLLQKVLLKQYPETKNLDNEKSQSIDNHADNDDDEEIPSDTEPEESDRDNDDNTEQHTKNTTKKKRKLSDYEKDLCENHKKYKPYRDSVIQKWNDKTRIAVMKTTTPTHSILNQIEYNLTNKEKLIKKTQLRRNQYKILGEKSNDDDNNDIVDEYNTNIYDDTDFYHQLLRELIEVKSADITDPVQLSRQWIQLQSLRNKMKRKIDTRATKGRKIRYVVHNKLVNFMAPIDNHKWSDEAKTDLFNSLFGRNQPIV